VALWICRGCTAAYAVGAPACPQCGGTEYVEDWNMPKISKGDGASYEPGRDPAGGAGPAPASADSAAEPEQPAVVEPEQEPARAPAPAPKK
jgi:hypothetical protein